MAVAYFTSDVVVVEASTNDDAQTHLINLTNTQKTNVDGDTSYDAGSHHSGMYGNVD